jgi:hypothetical protein
MTFSQWVQIVFVFGWGALLIMVVRAVRGQRRLEREHEEWRREILVKGMMPRRTGGNGAGDDQASDVPWSLQRPQARGRRNP